MIADICTHIVTRTLNSFNLVSVVRAPALKEMKAPPDVN